MHSDAKWYAEEVVRLRNALETIEVDIARGQSVYEIAQWVAESLRESLKRERERER
ncbi:MAG: hypothetical protein OWS03_02910 [Alicyclobacillaceae bacterium]|nr:hypothetical protein [Alicyclobacillaceae bacterium]